MGPKLLAVDIGTSAVRCALVGAGGDALATAHAPTPYHRPADAGALAREFRPQELFDTVSALARRVTAGAPAEDIRAVGITGQRHGVVFMDRHGQELMASPNVDLRAAFEGATLEEELGSGLYDAAGQRPALLLAPAKLRWLQNHRPDLYERVASVLTVAGWLAYRLTGEMADEPSLAAGVGLLDARTATRDAALLRKLGVPEGLAPPLLSAGEPLGRLRAGAAVKWGLRPGTPVTLAGADSACGMVGMGLVRPGDTGLVTGWSCTLQTVTPSPRPDPAARAWFSPHPLQGRWVAEANLGDAGNAHRWFKGLLLGQEASFEEADRLACAAPVGGNGSLAYLGGAATTAPAAGLRRGGWLFPTPLQYRSPTAGEALRAFWESVSYGAKANLGILEEVSGHRAETVRLGGGMARSRLFAEILACVLERPVLRSLDADVSLRGAGAAASVAAGLYNSLATACRAFAPEFETLTPDPAGSLEYRDLYHQWLDLYQRLQDG